MQIFHDWYSAIDDSSSCIFMQLNQGLWNEPLKTLNFQKWDFKMFFLFVLFHRLTIKKFEVKIDI